MRRYLPGVLCFVVISTMILLLDRTLTPRKNKADETMEPPLIIPTAISSGIMPELKAYYPVYLTPLPAVLEADPTKFSIVYVTAPSAIGVDDLLSATGELGRTLQARNAYSMNDLRRFHSEKPIEALVIHESAVSLIDPSWVKWLYRQGAVLAGVNIKYVDLLTLRNCPNASEIASKFPGLIEATSDSFYYVITKSVFSDDSETNALVQWLAFDQCESLDSSAELAGEISASSSSSQGKLERQNDVVDFVEAVILNIGRSRSAYQTFENRHLPATPVPGL